MSTTCALIINASGRAGALAALALALGACGGGGGAQAPQAAAPAAVANTAPTISGLSQGQTVAQDASGEPVAFSVDDAQSGAAGVVVKATSSNAAVLPPDGVRITGNGASRAIQLTPALDAAGVATLTITATDPAGATTSETIAVTVAGSPRSFSEMVGTAYALDEEAEGEELTGYSWVDDAQDDEAAFDTLLTE